ncbi:MAG TPA: FecR domain-containing protein [Polyangiales bacterium]|nr:FecR domain-containing protein [Polyangiales bacterium]
MCDHLADRLAQASRHIDDGFAGHDVERGISALETRITRRRRAAQAAVAAGALAAAALVALQWRAHERPPLVATAPKADVLTTHDGSVATLRDAQTLLAVKRDLPDEVALELARGRGHFEVTPNPRRRYRVHAGPVDVEVLGTAFEVERLGASVRVQVDHGVVRVGWSGGSSTLRGGESGTFPPPQAAAPAEAAPSPSAEPKAQKPAARDQWRALAKAGKHQEAFGSLGKQPVEDLPGLLLAADAARLSGHPREAARYLEHLVQHYPESPSAPLAAFTLGRLTLYELKQPALAARSFARAYTLDPAGALAEDALAREAEAYHQAGDAQRSKSAAERYLERFPRGARRKDLAEYAKP